MNFIRFIAVFIAVVLATASLALAGGTQSISLFTSGQKHFDKNEYSRAQADWQKAADQGDTQAMDKLAEIYANGTGVAVDETKALQYWHQAADAGDGEAMFQLAVSYQIARGVTQDTKESDIWLYKALEQCNQHAAVRILVKPKEPEENTDKAVACLKKSAEAGDYMAMMDLAGKVASGNYVLKNPLEAISWGHLAMETMQKKADKGDARAIYYMGRALWGGVGEGIPQDAKRALQLYEKAASLGDIDALNRLVTTYTSDDKYQDYKKVKRWNEKLVAQYTLRAKKGDVSAMVTLADKYYTPPVKTGADAGKPIPGIKGDVGKAVLWAEKAAALGNHDALFQLGYIHEDKANAHRDCKKARDFYEKAAAAGDRNAKARLGARARGAMRLDCDF